MRGLTLHRPMSWAISHCDKRIENRPQKPPAAMTGKLFAVHAGKTYNHGHATWIHDTFPHLFGYEESLLPSGVIVAVARLKGLCFPDESSPWYFGPTNPVTNKPNFGLELTDVHALSRPLPCSGMLGFWTVPTSIEVEIAAQLPALATEIALS